VLGATFIKTASGVTGFSQHTEQVVKGLGWSTKIEKTQRRRGFTAQRRGGVALTLVLHWGRNTREGQDSRTVMRARHDKAPGVERGTGNELGARAGFDPISQKV